MTGWIRLHRGWRDCDVFGDEPMTEREAWVWLIEKAAWKPCVRRTAKGERVQIERGQFHTSLRNLGQAWGWGKNKVDRFLERLVDHEMIGTVAGQSGCTITICNYDTYQDVRDSHDDEAGTASGQSRDTQEEGKELTSEDKSSSVVGLARTQKAEPFPRPEFADPQVWADFLKIRKAKRMTNSVTAYRGFLSDVDREQDDKWPPGRLLEHAVAKSWGSIHNPDKQEKSHGNDRQGSSKRGGRTDGWTAVLRDVGNREADYPYAGNG